jgi:hypothetical protein
MAQLRGAHNVYDGCRMMFVPLWVHNNIDNHKRIKFSNTCGSCHERFPCDSAHVFDRLVNDSGDGFVRTWFDLDEAARKLF